MLTIMLIRSADNGTKKTPRSGSYYGAIRVVFLAYKPSSLLSFTPPEYNNTEITVKTPFKIPEIGSTAPSSSVVAP